MWQDPMDDSQQKETRRRILNILDALISELTSRGLNVIRRDENTLVVNGMTFTATDQLSDTYNDVCYLLTDYNQMINCTLSRIGECADTIEELLEVQVEKMEFSKMVQKQRKCNNEVTKYTFDAWKNLGSVSARLEDDTRTIRNVIQTGEISEEAKNMLEPLIEQLLDLADKIENARSMI